VSAEAPRTTLAPTVAASPAETAPGRARSRRGRTGRRLAIIGGLITLFLIAMAALGPVMAPYHPTEVSLDARLKPPGAPGPAAFPYVLGTDQLGRDILSRILHAARVTVSIALVAVVASALTGVLLGLASGYFGGLFDMVLMRIADIQLSFPTILLALTIVAVFGTSIPILILVFVIPGWVRYVRIIRAQVLVLKQAQFVDAARVMGASDARILGYHLIPNLATEIIILVNLEVGRIILLESALSYLGLGVQPPLPTWGNMLNEGRLYLQTSWWVVTTPGFVIMLTVLGLNAFAEGLRGLYDPRSRG
jgi:peptide/nickel transport system permease protein